MRPPPETSEYHAPNDVYGATVAPPRRGRRRGAGGDHPAHRRAGRGGPRPRRAQPDVPDRAIDAQSLIACADLVVSAGGTMNREAVALGTPVYTTFSGRMGGVDEVLIHEGRLRVLEDPAALPLASGPTRSASAIRATPTSSSTPCSAPSPFTRNLSRSGPPGRPRTSTRRGTPELGRDHRRRPRLHRRRGNRLAAGPLRRAARLPGRGDRLPEGAQPARQTDAAPLRPGDPGRGRGGGLDLAARRQPEPLDPDRRGGDRRGRRPRRHLRPARAAEAGRPDRRGADPGAGRGAGGEPDPALPRRLRTARLGLPADRARDRRRRQRDQLPRRGRRARRRRLRDRRGHPGDDRALARTQLGRACWRR